MLEELQLRGPGYSLMLSTPGTSMTFEVSILLQTWQREFPQGLLPREVLTPLTVNLLWTNNDFRFGGCLRAKMGGFANFSMWGWLISNVFHRVLTWLKKLGILGSYVVTKGILFIGALGLYVSRYWASFIFGFVEVTMNKIKGVPSK